MRVGIDGVGLAVSGPAGVGDADAAGGVLVRAFFLQGRYLAGSLVDVEVAFGVNHGDTGRVVAAIFQSMKTLYQNGVSLLLTDISYYSTHSFGCFLVYLIKCKSKYNFANNQINNGM